MIRKFKQIKLINILFFPFRWLLGIIAIRKELIKLMMRTFIFLFCVTLSGLTPNSAISQSDKIKIDEDKVISIDGVFKIIKSQTDYSFVYHEDLFKDFPMVKLKKGVIQLNKLLDQSLPIGSVNVVFTTNNTILIKARNLKLRLRVSGTVTDQLGLPVSGATVLIKGTTKGTTTDMDGNYTITIPDPANVLVFSALGFKTQELTVGNQSIINISLKEDISELDQVTITGRYYNNSQRVETGSVSKIDAKTIEKQPVNNPLAAMQGHIPGVNITQNTGLSGGSYSIRIRGDNFLNPGGNEPLYIVDGVAYDSGSLEQNNTILAGGNIPGGSVNPLNTINPTDIQNIQVLKDADATAIYGSRGANGVVVITTKKGKVGKTQVKINVSSTLSEVTSFMDLLNTQQYLEVRKEALMNDGDWPVATDDESDFPDLFLWDQDRYTDWQDVLIGGTAYRQNAQLSFSGGSEFTQFLLSGGFVSETTVFPGDSKYNKATALLNVNHQSKNKRFHVNVSVNYGTDTNNLPGNSFVNEARTLAPNAPALYDEEGELNWENSTWSNPLAILETTYNAKTHNLIANTVLSYKPIPSLEFKTNLGYTDYRIESYFLRPHTFYDPNGDIGPSSSISIRNNGSRKSWIVEPQINWQHEWGANSLKLLLGGTFQQNTEQQLGILARGFPNNDLLLNLLSATSLTVQQDDASEYKYQSFFGRINLNWQGKYLLNLTGRRDGSSRFGPGKQFGYFGAIGAAWLFSEEGFLQESNILSFGKLRASYGITGNDSSPDYAFYDAFEASGIYNGSGLHPIRLFNPNFAWEETKKLETALELGFFKDRIFLSAAWYRNRSSNQVINTPLSDITGFSGINENFDAIVQNSGLEIDLRTVNIQNNHFKWTTTFNISANKNKLVKFDNLENSTFKNLKIGYPLNIRNLYNFLEVDPETGIAQFEDYNNDGDINTDDNNFIQDFTPKYFGGLGSTLQYKNIQLDMFFQFVKQKQRNPIGFTSSVTGTGSARINAPVAILDRWQEVGDNNPIQQYSIDNIETLNAWQTYKSSNVVIADASYIRLRNVSLSYGIPKDVVKGLDINIYVQGQNLFVITPYPEDPEYFRLPLRQFTLGINMGF